MDVTYGPAHEISVNEQTCQRHYTKYGCKWSLRPRCLCLAPVDMSAWVISIIKLLGHCKGGNFNIHIWAWFGYFISSFRGNRVLFLTCKEIISCNRCAFHENPDRIYTALTFINP